MENGSICCPNTHPISPTPFHRHERRPQAYFLTETKHQGGVTKLYPDALLDPVSDIIENALFILWRHMDFYYLHCVPSDDERSLLNQSSSTSARLRRLQGVWIINYSWPVAFSIIITIFTLLPQRPCMNTANNKHTNEFR